MSVSLDGVVPTHDEMPRRLSRSFNGLRAVPRTIDSGAISEPPAIFDSGRLMRRFLGILAGFRKFITKRTENQVDLAENALELVSFLAFPSLFQAGREAVNFCRGRAFVLAGDFIVPINR
ncbi:hypothetical protein RCCGEPOP_18628 [Rhizobium sp. Pop5]|nr:hypothetical protein RCCGEPOP_18628 [Rhizobium sp. Pop5]